jgi:hypothetical protein
MSTCCGHNQSSREIARFPAPIHKQGALFALVSNGGRNSVSNGVGINVRSVCTCGKIVYEHSTTVHR